MRDFKDYADSGEGKKIAGMAEEVAREYKGKSEGDVWQAIFARAEAGKRAGTLTNADIDAFCAKFSPMLNGAQKKKLKALAEKLKNIPAG